MGCLKYYEILKTNINVTDMESVLDYIKSNLDNLRGRYICVSNVHTTVMSYENEAYREIQNSGAMALPDGAPLSAYCRMNGMPEAKRVTGPDLMMEIFKVSGEMGYSHFFYGSSADTLDKMKNMLEERYPGIKIAGMYAPPFRALTDKEDLESIDMIKKADSDFIWVGLGAPKQEQWMYAHNGMFNGVMVGVGAAFDYAAGNIKRAPMIMQKLSLEWLYRLLQDPKRLWKRYVTTNFKFIIYIMKESRKRHG